MLLKTVGELKKFLENIPDNTPLAIHTRGYYQIIREVDPTHDISFDYGPAQVHTREMKSTDEPIEKTVLIVDM